MDFLGFTLKRFVWKTKVCDHQVENQANPWRTIEVRCLRNCFMIPILERTAADPPG